MASPCTGVHWNIDCPESSCNADAVCSRFSCRNLCRFLPAPHSGLGGFRPVSGSIAASYLPGGLQGHIHLILWFHGDRYRQCCLERPGRYSWHVRNDEYHIPYYFGSGFWRSVGRQRDDAESYRGPYKIHKAPRHDGISHGGHGNLCQYDHR